MTNAEKYKDVIRAREHETGDWAVDKHTGEVVDCNGVYCVKCLFCDDCEAIKIRWLTSEYKEQKEFTDDERKFIELFDKAEWVARDNDGKAYIFSSMPHKENGRWRSDNFCYMRLSLLTSLPFTAIKSTDTEPTSRAEILRKEK